MPYYSCVFGVLGFVYLFVCLFQEEDNILLTVLFESFRLVTVLK